MNRRKLIEASSLSALAACSTIPHTGVSTPIEQDTSEEEICDETPSQQEGPYYHTTLSDTIDLTNGATEGVISLSGLLIDTGCKAIAGAKIDIWHADTEGEYDLTEGERIHYGFLMTGEDGSFSLHTILPGAYLNGPNTYRPRHYHIKVWVEEVEVLVTQLYFLGDSFLDYEPGTPEALMLELEESGDGWTTEYTIIIDNK